MINDLFGRFLHISIYMLYMLVYWVVGILARLVTGHEPPKKNGLLHFWRFVSWRSLDGGSEFYKNKYVLVRINMN